MKYMIMMFGSAAEMAQTVSKEWIDEMISFMIQLDKDLVASGEMVYNDGLADGAEAKVVSQADGGITVRDGAFAEPNQSLIGFWIVDVASEERLLEIASSIVKYARQVELRPIPAGPPEFE